MLILVAILDNKKVSNKQYFNNKDEIQAHTHAKSLKNGTVIWIQGEIDAIRSTLEEYQGGDTYFDDYLYNP